MSSEHTSGIFVNGEYQRLKSFLRPGSASILHMLHIVDKVSITELIRRSVSAYSFAHEIDIEGGTLWEAYHDRSTKLPTNLVTDTSSNLMPIKSLAVDINPETAGTLKTLAGFENIELEDVVERAVYYYGHIVEAALYEREITIHYGSGQIACLELLR